MYVTTFFVFIVYFSIFIIILQQYVFSSKCLDNKTSQIQQKKDCKHVCAQVGVPVLRIHACLQRRRMLMLTVTLSHIPDIYTPRLETGRLSFQPHSDHTFIPLSFVAHSCLYFFTIIYFMLP